MTLNIGGSYCSNINDVCMYCIWQIWFFRYCFYDNRGLHEQGLAPVTIPSHLFMHANSRWYIRRQIWDTLLFVLYIQSLLIVHSSAGSFIWFFFSIFGPESLQSHPGGGSRGKYPNHTGDNTYNKCFAEVSLFHCNVAVLINSSRLAKFRIRLQEITA